MCRMQAAKSAESILREIKIVTTGTIHAEGPRTWGLSHGGWSVNYRLHVPRHVAAELHTHNGGIELTNVDGVINADTTNGGLILDDLGGDVHATTVNGGLQVKLDGTQWKGAGLFAKSTNGGISVKAPENYSAHLIAADSKRRHLDRFPDHRPGQDPQSHRHQHRPGRRNACSSETVNGGVSIHRD